MTALRFRIQGDEALVKTLAALPASIRAAVTAKLNGEASALTDYIQEQKLSGQVLNVKSGRLRSSIYSRVYPSGSKITLSTGVRGDVPYAAIHEYGGTTPPHEIVAIKAKVLAFLGAAGKQFAYRVAHPGSTMPERSYIRTSLVEKNAELTTSVTETIMETIHASGL